MTSTKLTPAEVHFVYECVRYVVRNEQWDVPDDVDDSMLWNLFEQAKGITVETA
jgi:hypothetical protein